MVLKKFSASLNWSMLARETRGSSCAGRSCQRNIIVASPCHKLRYADQTVGGGGQDDQPFDQRLSDDACLADPGDARDSAEGLLYPLTVDRADTITGMANGACVNRRATIRIISREMRSSAAFAAARHEVGNIMFHIAAHRGAGLGIVSDQIKCGLALCRPVGRGHRRIDDMPVGVLRHQMSQMIKLELVATHLQTWSCVARFAPPNIYNNRASAWMVENCVSFLHFSPWNSRSELRRPLPP